jgi:hypothetical protein
MLKNKEPRGKIMKILIMLITAVMLMSVTSCSYFKSTVVPQAKKKAADAITKAIVETGECQATDAVQADVEALLKIESDNSLVVKALNESAPEGSQAEGVASEICKAAASLAIPALLDKGVPSKWECGLSDLSEKINQLAAQACDKV